MTIRVAALVTELAGILLTLLAVYGWGRSDVNSSTMTRPRDKSQAVDCDYRRPLDPDSEREIY
jgi:hypothetical protein